MSSVHRMLVATIGVSILALVSRPTPVNACTCPTPVPPLVAASKSDVVLIGTVTYRAFSNDGGGVDCRNRRGGVDPALARNELYQVACLRVEASIKGSRELFDEVAAITSATMCGYPMKLGTAHLVYAGESQAGIRFSSCSRSTAIASAQEDLAAFGLTYPILHRVFLPQIISPNPPRSVAALQRGPVEVLRSPVRYGPTCSSQAQTAARRHRRFPAR